MSLLKAVLRFGFFLVCAVLGLAMFSASYECGFPRGIISATFGACVLWFGICCLQTPKKPFTTISAPAKRSEATPQTAPRWFFPAGVVAIGIGLLAFCASAVFGSGAEPGDPPRFRFLAALLSGALNPLFFVGVPLGLYWLYRSGHRPPQHQPPGAPSSPANNNPSLTHCPDCGGHVSRRAPTCPHCGRPLTPEIPQ